MPEKILILMIARQSRSFGTASVKVINQILLRRAYCSPGFPVLIKIQVNFSAWRRNASLASCLAF
jgi:hypothetical protein